jgi:hypothetical protein
MLLKLGMSIINDCAFYYNFLPAFLSRLLLLHWFINTPYRDVVLQNSYTSRGHILWLIKAALSYNVRLSTIVRKITAIPGYAIVG